MIGGQRNDASCYYLHHGGLALLVFRAVSVTLGHGQYLLLLPMLLGSTEYSHTETSWAAGPCVSVYTVCTAYFRL